MASEQILFPARLRAADFAHFRASTAPGRQKYSWRRPFGNSRHRRLPSRIAEHSKHACSQGNTVTGAAGDI